MRLSMMAVAMTAAAGFASPAAAANGCDGPKTGFDSVYCFARVYMELDGQLNASYRGLMRQLNPAQTIALRQGQREWMAMRDRTCLDSSARGNTVNIDCAIGTTRRRVQFLSGRTAECRANGCRMSLLGKID